MRNTFRIAVQVETNRAHGRSMLEGIADYAIARPDWRLEAVAPDALSDATGLRHFDGFIVRVMDDRSAGALLKTRKPAIDTYGRDDYGRIPFIRLDDDAIAKSADACFAEHRYTHCAFCGFKGLRFSEARGRAFAGYVRSRGGTCEIYGGEDARLKETAVRNERMDAANDHAALRRWIKKLAKPVAVFCCNDLRAYQLLKACADAGISVPGDAAVLGVDNDKVLCTFANPPISSIDTDPFSLGQTAARMLDGLLETLRKKPPAATLHRPRRVVERASTEFYPAKIPWLSDALIYIRRHLGEGIAAADVCRRLGYSHTTVGKAFRDEFGTSVQQEIMRQRRELACRLLKETRRTAADIAAECGYPSAQYFAHVFAKSFGATPDVWRRGGEPGNPAPAARAFARSDTATG